MNMWCFYCGDNAECGDHVIPFSYNSYTGYRTKRENVVDWKNVVPACMECNGMKSDKIFSSYYDIAHYLLHRYRKRYKKVLNYPKWNNSQLEELDYPLRMFILSKQILKTRIKLKIRNLNRLLRETEIIL